MYESSTGDSPYIAGMGDASFEDDYVLWLEDYINNLKELEEDDT